MLSRHASPLLVLVLVGGLAASANPASAAPRLTTICQQRGYTAVTAPHGGHYVVRNDNYGGRPECISNRDLRPNFTVTRSAANSYSSRVMAFPFVLYGCSWGLCTAGSRLPAPVRSLRRVTATWYTAGQAAGQWNTAFDIWFGRHRAAYQGQAKGAELMVWLNAHDYPALRSRIIRVDHRRWYVSHWVTSHKRRALELHPDPRGQADQSRAQPVAVADHQASREDAPGEPPVVAAEHRVGLRDLARRPGPADHVVLRLGPRLARPRGRGERQ